MKVEYRLIIVCIKTERTLRNDFTVAYEKKLYQIEERTRASKVMVHEQINGSLKITYQDRPLRFKEITTRPIKQEKAPVRERITKRSIPSPNHPWRNFKFGSRKHERGRAIIRPEDTVDCAMQSEAQG